MIKKINYSVYLVTDRELMTTKTLEEAVELAIKGGATLIQLREKNCSSLEFYKTAVNIKCITDRYKIPLLINDRLDIAQAVNADGIHIGQSDIPCAVARNILGDDKIIGVSAENLEEALKAQKDGADYLGVGAVYPTGTKKDATTVTMDELKRIKENVKIPIVVIGGVNKERIKDFKGIGIAGVAVVSAIIAKKDIKKAAEEIKEEFEKIC